MDTFINAMNKMQQAGTRNERLDALDDISTDAILLFQNALSPDIIFGVKKWDFPSTFSTIDLCADYTLTVFKVLEASDRTPAEKKLLFKNMLSKHTMNTAKWLMKVAEKKLGHGVTIKLLNEYCPGVIDTFDIALCDKFLESIVKDINAGKCIIEPKYDGIRLVVVYHDGPKYYTRSGKQMPQLGKLLDDNMFALYESLGSLDYVIDGELVGNTFEETMSLRAVSTDELSRENLIYAIFDIIPFEEWRESVCTKRLQYRKLKLEKYFPKTGICSQIHLVPYKYVNSYEHMLEEYSKLLDEGYEGCIIKNIESLYPYKRSKAWTKLKPEQTFSGIIVDIIEGTGKYKCMMGAIVVDGIEQGEPFSTKVGTGFSDVDRDNFWKFKSTNIGREVEIKGQSMTNDCSIRFPKFFRFLD